MTAHQTKVTFRNRTYRAGDVYRHPTIVPWGDHIILGLTEDDGDRTEVKLARPYAYASSVGTTGPTVLQGAEVYTLPITHLVTWEKLNHHAFVI